MSYSDIVATIAMIVSISAVPASGYLSYRYATKGEKRKEFNLIADQIRFKLRDQIRSIDNGYYPGGKISLSEQEIEYFIDNINKNGRENAKLLFQEYNETLKACGCYDEHNIFTFSHPEKLSQIIQKLLPLTNRH